MSKLRTLFRTAQSVAPFWSAVQKEAGVLGAVAVNHAMHQTAQRTASTLAARWTFASAGPGSSSSAAVAAASSFLRQALNTTNRRGLASAAATAASSAAAAAGPVSYAASLTAGLTPGTRRAIAAWLVGCSGWVFSLVVLGGMTRLTRSGLSMTDWKFTGERPPQSQTEWETEFERYKLSPEFKRVNSTMTVDEFKFIYWMEWGHRMWGRTLGLVFAVPCALFVARGAVNKPLARRLGLLFLMGGTQGLVGWWMVRSGLVEPEDNRVPRVSAYRLAAHLTSAFAIYATMVWTALSVGVPHPPAVTAGPPAARAAAALYRMALPVSVLMGVTAISGAFVAGLDAGHAYNTFPDMNGQWIPDEYWDKAGWRNAFENTAAVQLHHRVLALSTLGATAALWRYGSRLPDLPRASRLLLNGLAVGVAAQVSLGVATLLTYVPVSLGAAHQAGALTLFTLALSLLYTVRPVPTLAPFRMLLTAPYSTIGAATAVVALGSAVASSA